MSYEDKRPAKELSVGQHVRLVDRGLKDVFVVVSADHHGSPFFATNVRVQRLVLKKLLGFIPYKWEGSGLKLLLDPEEKVILV